MSRTVQAVSITYLDEEMESLHASEPAGLSNERTFASGLPAGFLKEDGLEPSGVLREALAAWRALLEAKRREFCTRFDAESDPESRLNFLVKIWKCVHKARLLDELLDGDG